MLVSMFTLVDCISICETENENKCTNNHSFFKYNFRKPYKAANIQKRETFKYIAIMEQTEAGRFKVSKIHETSSADHAYSAAGTHLLPGNINVSVTHFIDDIDDSDIFVNHTFARFVFLKYAFSNVRFVIVKIYQYERLHGFFYPWNLFLTRN